MTRSRRSRVSSLRLAVHGPGLSLSLRLVRASGSSESDSESQPEPEAPSLSPALRRGRAVMQLSQVASGGRGSCSESPGPSPARATDVKVDGDVGSGPTAESGWRPGPAAAGAAAGAAIVTVRRPARGQPVSEPFCPRLLHELSWWCGGTIYNRTLWRPGFESRFGQVGSVIPSGPGPVLSPPNLHNRTNAPECQPSLPSRSRS